MKCKNCGHELASCGMKPHKNIVQFKYLKSVVCCGEVVEGNILCGCTMPEPEAVSP